MDNDTERRGPGRPATGQVPVRTVRVGTAWDEAKEVAKERGEKFSDVVDALLKRYVARHRQSRREPPVGAPPNRPPAGYLPYGERKPYTVADNLDDLIGPTTGVVTLPHHIDWSGSPTFNLDRPARLASMYKAVLAEANSVDDLNTWLNRDRLIELWTDLYLPPKVRRLWEERFPQLAATAQPLSR